MSWVRSRICKFTLFLIYFVERMLKEWSSPVYTFFKAEVIYSDGRRAHQFCCRGLRCSVKIRRFLDTKDSKSTSNLRKHVKSCWGEDVMNTADDAKDVNDVRTKIVNRILRNGSIMEAFERKGKGKPTHSTRPHTPAETR